MRAPSPPEKWCRITSYNVCYTKLLRTGGRPAVLLTFDDGFRDLLTRVAPVLREHGFCATTFLVSNRMRPDDEPGMEGEIVADQAHEAWLTRGERSTWLSWAELRGLVRNNFV